MLASMLENGKAEDVMVVVVSGKEGYMCFTRQDVEQYRT